MTSILNDTIILATVYKWKAWDYIWSIWVSITYIFSRIIGCFNFDSLKKKSNFLQQILQSSSRCWYPENLDFSFRNKKIFSEFYRTLCCATNFIFGAKSNFKHRSRSGNGTWPKEKIKRNHASTRKWGKITWNHCLLRVTVIVAVGAEVCKGGKVYKISLNFVPLGSFSLEAGHMAGDFFYAWIFLFVFFVVCTILFWRPKIAIPFSIACVHTVGFCYCIQNQRWGSSSH